TLSCEHRCPPRNRLRPSFHLLGMEAENARNSSNAPSRAATAESSQRTLIGSIMRSGSNTTTAATHPVSQRPHTAPSLAVIIPLLESIFIAIGGPLTAHRNNNVHAGPHTAVRRVQLGPDDQRRKPERGKVGVG